MTSHKLPTLKGFYQMINDSEVMGLGIGKINTRKKKPMNKTEFPSNQHNQHQAPSTPINTQQSVKLANRPAVHQTKLQQKNMSNFYFANINVKQNFNQQLFHLFTRNIISITTNFQSKLPQGLYALWRKYYNDVVKASQPDKKFFIDRKSLTLMISHLSEIAQTLYITKIKRVKTMNIVHAKELFLLILKFMLKEVQSYPDIGSLIKALRSRMTINSNLIFWTAIACIQCVDDIDIVNYGNQILHHLSVFSQNFIAFSKRILKGTGRVNDFLFMSLREHSQSAYQILINLSKMKDQSVLRKCQLYDQVFRFLMLAPYMLNQFKLIIYQQLSVGKTAQLFKKQHGVPIKPDYMNKQQLIEILKSFLPHFPKQQINIRLIKLTQQFEPIYTQELLVQTYCRVIAVILEYIVLKKNMISILSQAYTILSTISNKSPYDLHNKQVIEIINLFAEKHKIPRPVKSEKFLENMKYPPYLEHQFQNFFLSKDQKVNMNMYAVLCSELRQIVIHDEIAQTLTAEDIFKKHSTRVKKQEKKTQNAKKQQMKSTYSVSPLKQGKVIKKELSGKFGRSFRIQSGGNLYQNQNEQLKRTKTQRNLNSYHDRSVGKRPVDQKHYLNRQNIIKFRATSADLTYDQQEPREYNQQNRSKSRITTNRQIQENIKFSQRLLIQDKKIIDQNLDVPKTPSNAESNQLQEQSSQREKPIANTPTTTMVRQKIHSARRVSEQIYLPNMPITIDIVSKFSDQKIKKQSSGFPGKKILERMRINSNELSRRQNSLDVDITKKSAPTLPNKIQLSQREESQVDTQQDLADQQQYKVEQIHVSKDMEITYSSAKKRPSKKSYDSRENVLTPEPKVNLINTKEFQKIYKKESIEFESPGNYKETLQIPLSQQIENDTSQRIGSEENLCKNITDHHTKDPSFSKLKNQTQGIITAQDIKQTEGQSYKISLNLNEKQTLHDQSPIYKSQNFVNREQKSRASPKTNNKSFDLVFDSRNNDEKQLTNFQVSQPNKTFSKQNTLISTTTKGASERRKARGNEKKSSFFSEHDEQRKRTSLNQINSENTSNLNEDVFLKSDRQFILSSDQEQDQRKINEISQNIRTNISSKLLNLTNNNLSRQQGISPFMTNRSQNFFNLQRKSLQHIKIPAIPHEQHRSQSRTGASVRTQMYQSLKKNSENVIVINKRDIKFDLHPSHVPKSPLKLTEFDMDRFENNNKKVKRNIPRSTGGTPLYKRKQKKERIIESGNYEIKRQ